MNRHIFHSLSQAQCIQITALHALCAPEKKAPEQEPSVLCLVLPDPDSSEEDVFYGLYYIEETLVSFLSFFCPDGKTAGNFRLYPPGLSEPRLLFPPP